MTETALRLINKHWPESIQPVEVSECKNGIFEAVRRRLRYLLDNDMERLLHTLYRVDVPENQVREVLSITAPGAIDESLTNLVIRRIEEKIETRRKYGTGQ